MSCMNSDDADAVPMISSDSLGTPGRSYTNWSATLSSPVRSRCHTIIIKFVPRRIAVDDCVMELHYVGSGVVTLSFWGT